MSSLVETGVRSDTAAGAIAQYLRVKTAGALAIAGLADKEIGVIETDAFAAGDKVPVRLRTAQGTCKMVAGEAIAANAAVYTAAAGKVADTAAETAYLIGTALTAATADGDVIEVLRNSHGDTAVPAA